MTERVPKISCKCGQNLDAATSAFGNHALKPGDISVCLYCGNAAQFTAELTLAPLNRSQLSAAELAEIRTCQQAILELRHQRN